MFLANLTVENFRVFGEGEKGLSLSLQPGLTALVGENDTGNTAVIDALRLVLGTRDQEFFRLEDTDFHCPPEAGPKSASVAALRASPETMKVHGSFQATLGAGVLDCDPRAIQQTGVDASRATTRN
ncbi:MAG: AAA family ATPase [Acidobacteriota bacterium]|jgi:putative ATP-dependent endonuclease of OLD family